METKLTVNLTIKGVTHELTTEEARELLASLKVLCGDPLQVIDPIYPTPTPYPGYPWFENPYYQGPTCRGKFY